MQFPGDAESRARRNVKSGQYSPSLGNCMEQQRCLGEDEIS
jgi:hypothetical protein